MPDEKISDLVSVLRQWGELGRLTAEHIVNCETCMAADIMFGDKGYCAMGDRLWAAHMQAESKVVAILPRLRAEGIDVERFCRENNFQFIAK